MKRVYRHVNDHGEIYRMTETRYGKYLSAGTLGNKFPDANEFGMYIGSALTVNNLTPAEFSDEYKAFNTRPAGQRAKRKQSMVRIYKQGKKFCSACRGLFAVYSRNGDPDQIVKHSRVRLGPGHPPHEQCPGSNRPPLKD